MAYLVRIMPRAERDLEAIFEYIQAESSAPACRWINGLVAAIESLAELPYRNSTIVEDSTLRHLLYGRKPHVYRIIYSINNSKQMVNIIHVRHSARDTFDSSAPES